jgi:hypothetical protein
VAIDRERMRKGVTEVDEQMRKKMMPGSAGSGSSSGAPHKYRMVYTPPGGVSCVGHNNSRIGAIAHNSNRGNFCSNSSNNNSSTMLLLHCCSKLPPGHHRSFSPATSHASTARRWATLLENATSQSKASHRELWHPWSSSRGAIRRVLHDRLATPTTPLWRRFPREKTY